MPDWAGAERHELRGCSLQPTSTASGGADARVNALSADAVLYAPPGSDLASGDRVEAGGATWSVDGTPFERASPTGRASHLVAKLSLWRG